MSERKVLNKYFPPDFDPSLIPRRRGPKNSQQVVRLMAPFSMRCNTCGEYIYKGKKFNARKETVEGEDYFGIKIFRFYIKCPLCSAEITFKTDPKNTDYASEHGASRNFEPWRDEKAVEEEDRLARLEEEENNPMKALENRTLDSKREMEILDALGDIRARNARNERVAMGVMTGEKDMLDRIARDEVEEEAMRAKRLEDEEDERLVREVFSRVVAGSGPIAGPSGLNGGDGEEEEEEEPKQVAMTIVKRKAEGDEPDVLDLLSENAKALLQPSASSPSTQAKKSSTAGPSSSGIGAPKASTIPSLAGVVVKKRKADASSALGIKVKKKKAVVV